MQYKTIVLELMNQHPRIADLRRRRQLMPAVERYSQELKALHETWKINLAQARPSSDPAQIPSEALELAIDQIKDRLRCEFL